MNAELAELNVPLLYKFFKAQTETVMYFHRIPNGFGVGTGVTPAKVSISNTADQLKILAKTHDYDPNEIYDQNDGLPIFYSKD